MTARPLRSRLGIVAAALLLAANVVAPLVWGDLYPFTSAPMFRDAPRQCCNYRVLAADGSELPASNWLLQRIYDGNPVGYGVGVKPPPVLEAEFGVVPGEAAVRKHVERQFREAQNASHALVDVIQEVVGPIDRQHVGVQQINCWRIQRP